VVDREGDEQFVTDGTHVWDFLLLVACVRRRFANPWEFFTVSLHGGAARHPPRHPRGVA
jgi:hypothetical protein